MEVSKGASDDFVTVVSVGSQSAPENFVTVLSIGTERNEKETTGVAVTTAVTSSSTTVTTVATTSSSSTTTTTAATSSEGQANGPDAAHLWEEEVEVFRLPGERLGFGLKFEGGNKTSERVRRLFVQSCAEQSPASRAKCSWGALSEGDEVIAIDGIPVAHMTRLDCVRRLKESQLVIRLMVRCRGALRPEVVSAERKGERSKVPPELPSAPPPVPPRKLRHPRGSADGEANPSPAIIETRGDSPESRNGSPPSAASSSTTSSSVTGSSASVASQQMVSAGSDRSTSFESCQSSPRSITEDTAQDSRRKESPKERSPELKSKQEPPEAMVYLDARSQSGSTHGSTSDDTGSSMSTVVDRFSSSDRVSTISSNASTTSTASEQQLGESSTRADRSNDRPPASKSTTICPLEELDREFSAGSNQPDYLLRRLANSEAVTHVESRGEVERITAVVAPNTVLIEETFTLQPPLSFQDAPLSYGHEPRPNLFYSADLAADSTTHFRPIKDDAEVVDRVNGDHSEFGHDGTRLSPTESSSSSLSTAKVTVLAEKRTEKDVDRLASSASPPPLPARNHVNRVSVEVPQVTCEEAPILPPKPLPRRDPKMRRKRLPPPPPPPNYPPSSHQSVPQIPSTQIPSRMPPAHPPPSQPAQQSQNPPETSPRAASRSPLVNGITVATPPTIAPREKDASNSPDTADLDERKKSCSIRVENLEKEISSSAVDLESCLRLERQANRNNSTVVKKDTRDYLEPEDTCDQPQRKRSSIVEEVEEGTGTNKVLEIIEIRKARILSSLGETAASRNSGDGESVTVSNFDKNQARQEQLDSQQADTSQVNAKADHSVGSMDFSIKKDNREAVQKENASPSLVYSSNFEESTQRDEDDETYRSLDEVNDDLENSGVEGMVDNSDLIDEDDTTSDESEDGDYYWQSNLATIGEEEETTSLEYANCDKGASDLEPPREEEESKERSVPEDVGYDVDCMKQNAAEHTDDATGTRVSQDRVNGRMENCEGGLRLPPDGDEFPASYQEFGAGNDNYRHRYVSGTSTDVASATEVPTIITLGTTTPSVATIATVTVTGDSIGVAGPPEKKDRILENARVNTRLNDVDRQVDREDVTSIVTEDVGIKNGITVGTHPRCSRITVDFSANVADKKVEAQARRFRETPIDGKSEAESRIGVAKESSVLGEVPPPLPLTDPPKIEPVLSHGKNLVKPSVAPPVTQSPRKFSLNGEFRRQDDKSEKSVRDKIAMFSSRSSFDGPLFPTNTIAGNVIANSSASSSPGSSKRLTAKYKSSEDVCMDESGATVERNGLRFLASERAQSSFDLTDSVGSISQDNKRSSPGSVRLAENSYHRRISPPTPSTFFASDGKPSGPTICSSTLATTKHRRSIDLVDLGTNSGKSGESPVVSSAIDASKLAVTTGATTALTRATSFSGTMQLGRESSPQTTNTQISRTNSLASTFARPSDDAGRTSLNRIIEQRRRSISKLRGLVIPEKETVTIDCPIVDLPEIKSRDSILLQQVPKSSIHDKWGSQSSLASNSSSASQTSKTTASCFKMPAPQIHSKYSPAFKRRSLTVYGSSSSNGSSTTTNENNRSVSRWSSKPSITSNATVMTTLSGTSSTTATTSTSSSEPPKSLESICSPTRSDYSFEFVSSSSTPEGQPARPSMVHRRTRTDYDDSDNDSAVSSSQSSISRGFSPPASPVLSERSTVHSERSFASTDTNDRRQGSRSFTKQSYDTERSRLATLSGSFSNSEKSCWSPTDTVSSSRSPQSNLDSFVPQRNSQIPQRQATSLRRSNSTDTNRSTSSTLTSGSQASADSLSRRVLKPRSVEAINRKNILASARCRSGRDLNGSPLIQRKFPEDEAVVSASLRCADNGERQRIIPVNGEGDTSSVKRQQDVKIAYIEVTDSCFRRDQEEEIGRRKTCDPKPISKNVPAPSMLRSPNQSMLEPSNDLKKWVQAEVKAMTDYAMEKSENVYESVSSVRCSTKGGYSTVASVTTTTTRIPSSRDNSCSVRTHEERGASIIFKSHGKNSKADASRGNEHDGPQEDLSKVRSRVNASSEVTDKASSDPNDLLTFLTTRSRSRAAIRVDEGIFGRSKSQMSLEDILDGKGEAQVSSLRGSRGETVESQIGQRRMVTNDILHSTTKDDSRFVGRKSYSQANDFVSKIPTLAGSRISDANDTGALENGDNFRTGGVTRLPGVRGLARRSASVTDMKKALERMDTSANGPHQLQQVDRTFAEHHNHNHNRYASLDSSVDETSITTASPVGPDRNANGMDSERFGEQFGSISSLASSTSLISQQELAQLVEEASLEEARGAHDVIVVLLHKENPSGSVGIALAGGADCEVKEITVHRVLAHSIADRDGRVQRGDRILSINGKSTRGLTHGESLAVLKQPRSEIVLVMSRPKNEDGCQLRSRTASVETIVEGFETSGGMENTAWGPPSVVAVYKDGAGLGFSLEGGRDSPLGDRPLVIKKIFTGGAAEKTGALKPGDQLLEVNGNDVTRMSRIEAWSLMKKLHDGEVNLLVRHPATKSS